LEVVTLFYLASQVRLSRQATEANSKLLEHSVRQSTFQALQQFYLEASGEYQSKIYSKVAESIDDEKLLGLVAPIEVQLKNRFGLTFSEGLSFWNSMLVENKQREFEYLEYLDGRREKPDIFGLAYIHIHPAESIVWSHFRRFGMFDKRYIEYVDSFQQRASAVGSN
jgi:hypothetical protein